MSNYWPRRATIDGVVGVCVAIQSIGPDGYILYEAPDGRLDIVLFSYVRILPDAKPKAARAKINQPTLF